MSINSNQFALEPVAGEVDMTVTGQVVSAQVYESEASALVAGQLVKLVDSASGLPIVTARTADTDPIFGTVIRNAKDQSFAAGKRLEVALAGSLVWLTASAAIARGAMVEMVESTDKVRTATGAYPVVGMAFDKAAADGDLIRVLRQNNDIVNASRSLIATATLAEINAGKVLIPGVAGKQLVVTDITARVTGGFATTTSVDLQAETAGTKVSVGAVAALTNGAVLKPGDANFSRGAGYAVALTAGEGLKVVNVGSAATGGTSIAYTFSYYYV